MEISVRAPRRTVLLGACVVTLVVGASAATVSVARTSHAGWPEIDGMLLMNKLDQDRPLDARPGHDPFGGTDPAYRCDGLHRSQACLRGSVTDTGEGFVVRLTRRHNELLGGHGDDTIHAGPNGDVIWGDDKPSGQPDDQRDALVGGPGEDFIYASHGANQVAAGAGDDTVRAHFGRGRIDCGGGADVLYVSRKAKPRYRITRCETVSHKTLGY